MIEGEEEKRKRKAVPSVTENPLVALRDDEVKLEADRLKPLAHSGKYSA